MQVNCPSTSIIILIAASFLAAGPAAADVINGDFEDGGTGWTVVNPSGWAGYFPPSGGNPDGAAVMRSPDADSAGIGCFWQTFMCGEPSDETECVISLDYRLEDYGAEPGTGRVLMVFDGVTTLLTDMPGEWMQHTFTVPCGEHTIELCLEVDEGSHFWVASFDNVQAYCSGVVPAEEESWSAIKTLFR